VRILYLNPCGQMGGAEISLLDLLTSMSTAEPDCEMHLVVGEDGPLVARVQDLGIQVAVAPFPCALARLGDSGTHPLAVLWTGLKAIPGTMRYVAGLHKKISAIKPDVIHTNGFKMHVLAVWARSSGTPVIWHIRDYVSSRLLMKHLLRLHARYCACVIGISQSVTRDIQEVCGSRLEATCLYNAVDLRRFSPDGEQADLDLLSAMPPATQGTMRIGLISTLARWKGHAVFLRALARLTADLQYRAYVIGGAIYQTDNSQQNLDELRALARRLGIADKVGFTGLVREPACAMRALDVIVHASTQPEPFGRVIAEGMACGRPVICSAAGGAKELIADGFDALAYTPGDEVALANRITQLARSPELRTRLGRAGRVTAERRFDLTRLAKEVMPIYRRIVSGDLPQPSAKLAATR
jgi:glycosyltransferase involved in cell wall biosynthesis